MAHRNAANHFNNQRDMIGRNRFPLKHLFYKQILPFFYGNGQRSGVSIPQLLTAKLWLNQQGIFLFRRLSGSAFGIMIGLLLISGILQGQTPEAPTGLSVTPEGNGAYISFTPPSGTVTDYEYTTDNGTLWSSTGTPQSPVFIPGLTNCTNYTIKIRAVNLTLKGTASDALNTTTLGGTTGFNWTSRNEASAIIWSSVTYGKELFVAVSTVGTPYGVMTSPDGVNWTIRTSAAENSWNSVTYGNGLFVAVASSGTGNRVMTSPDGITWTSSTSAADNEWRSVTYGNGRFVAVASLGTGNRVMTSTDGIIWTICTSAADNNWYSVTYGNGLFVAVASSGIGNRVMTSTDGITWTIGTSAVSNNWRCVTFANGLFVAVANTGTGNRVMTSPDGYTWSGRSASVNNPWNSVTYGNGLFVAVASLGTGNRVMTSPDGINWTSRSSAADNPWNSVTYGNGLYVAVAGSGTGNAVMTSTWVQASSSPVLSSVTGGDASATVAFTVPSTDGGYAISGYDYSNDDGTNWLRVSSTTSPFTITSLRHGTTYLVKLRAINANGFSCPTAATTVTTTTPSAPAAPTGLSATTGINGVYISFTPPSGTVTDYEYTTNDGSLWSSIGVPQGPVFIPSLTNCTNYTIKIRAVNQTLRGSASIAVNATPSEGKAAGINWTSQDAAANNYEWRAVTYGKELFVAVASSGQDNRVMTSADGITWTSRNSPVRNSWKSVTYGNGLFVAVSIDGTGNRVMTSPDGNNWTSRVSAADNAWNSVTYGNGVFVAVASSGNGNRVMTSPDGNNWTSRVSAADNAWNSVTFGNDIFVAVATSGTGNRVMTSPDGFTWTIRNYAAENDWRCVTFGNGLFVAVASTGTGNRVMTSTDGINWTIRNSAANAVWTSVAYGNGLFVAVTSSSIANKVMTSTDGFTWTTRSSESTSSQWYAMIFGNNRFVVVAYSGGPSSKRVMTSTWAPASDAPTLSSVTGGDASATVAFTAPASDGGSAITGYDYSTNDGTTWTSTAATSSPITITGLSHGTTYLVKLRAVNDNGFSCPTAASSVTTKIVYAWTGASSTEWNDVANWSQASIPVTGDHVSIPTAATRNPTLDQDRDLLNLTVEAGRTLDLVTYTLSVKGSLSLNGTISGTGRLSLAGSSAQTVSGNGTVTNLEVNNNTGVTLGTGGNMLKVSGALIPTLGTLTTNGNLTLQSNASGTARIAPMPTSGAVISGLVTVERYLPQGRKWRMLTAPLTGASNNSIFQPWQNNDVMSAGTGVEIWGPGGHADPSSDNTGLALGAGFSMRSYGTGWQNVINTNSSLLFDGSTNFGYALFAAGPYNNGTSIIGTSQAAQNTTLSATGTLITGDHTKSFTSIAGQYFLVGNPYASPVNPGSFTAAGPENRTNLSATLWMWDAKPGAGTGNGLGRYVSFDPSSNSYNVIGNGYGVNVMIQSGQAFFVQALADGPATLVFRETSKEVNGSHDMMGNALQSPKSLLRFTLQQPISSDSSENLDGAVAVFHADGRAGLDPLDGSKLMNSSENLYFRRESRNLTFEHRPVPGANDTLHLRMGNMQAMHYRLMAQASDFTGVDGLTAELTDRYTGRSVPLSLKGDTYFPFTVTPDSMSTGERFLVVFSKVAAPVVVAPDLPTPTNRLSVYPNPVREHLKVVINLDMPQPFRLQVFDASGTEVWRRPSLAAGTRTVDINTSAFNSGMYTIVLADAKGMTTVAKFIRE